jgi:proteasome assembly chaperone (PAC2) family protein
MIDPRAAMVILRVLIKKLGLEIETKELEAQAKELEDALRKGSRALDQPEAGAGKYVG